MNPSRRVLICDDEMQILRALRVVLSDAGYEVEAAVDGESALNAAAVRPPDAAIIDLMLPDINGVEVCKALREWTQIPIIMLSAIDEEEQKVAALEAGADDYVVKPFAPRELVARLDAALRRVGDGADEAVVVIEQLEFDLARRRVRVAEIEVHLTPIEFDLLKTLVRNRGRLLTHAALLREVWGPAYESDTPTLRTHIANLRRKIEPPGSSRLIITDPGIGYRFAS